MAHLDRSGLLHITLPHEFSMDIPALQCQKKPCAQTLRRAQATYRVRFGRHTASSSRGGLAARESIPIVMRQGGGSQVYSGVPLLFLGHLMSKTSTTGGQACSPSQEVLQAVHSADSIDTENSSTRGWSVWVHSSQVRLLDSSVPYNILLESVKSIRRMETPQWPSERPGPRQRVVVHNLADHFHCCNEPSDGRSGASSGAGGIWSSGGNSGRLKLSRRG